MLAVQGKPYSEFIKDVHRDLVTASGLNFADEGAVAPGEQRGLPPPGAEVKADDF